MTNEFELIWLLSVQADGAPCPDKVSAILREGILDWEQVIAVSSREGVAAIVYDRLRKNRLERFVPGPVLSRFESVYYTYSAQNILLFAELKQIIWELEQASVSAITLKGAFLAAVVYENVALRPMKDLDLLVKKQDVAKAVASLKHSGYLPIVDVKQQLKDPFAYSVTLQKENAGINTGVSLDLHWHILNTSWLMGLSAGSCDMQRIWEAAQPVVINDIRILALSPEDLLICLAVNAFTHCYQRIILLVDFVMVLNHYQGKISWDFVLLRAKDCYLEDILKYTRTSISGMALAGKDRSCPGGGIFKREYRPLRPLLMYIFTRKGAAEKIKAILRLGLVITSILFKRLEHKNT